MKGSPFRRSTTRMWGLTLMLAPLWMAQGQQPAVSGSTLGERFLLASSTHSERLLLVPSVRADARPAWLMSSVQMGKLSVPTPSLALVGAAAVAGGVGSLFGLKCRSQVQAMHDATLWDDRVARHGEAVRSAQTANVLFGTAAVLALSAVVTGWIATSGGNSHVEVTP